MIVSKSYTRTYDIYDAAKWMATYGEIIESRRKFYGEKDETQLSKCFVCGHRFEALEIPWLGLVKNHKNVFLCEECGKKVSE